MPSTGPFSKKGDVEGVLDAVGEGWRLRPVGGTIWKAPGVGAVCGCAQNVGDVDVKVEAFPPVMFPVVAEGFPPDGSGKDPVDRRK